MIFVCTAASRSRADDRDRGRDLARRRARSGASRAPDGAMCWRYELSQWRRRRCHERQWCCVAHQARGAARASADGELLLRGDSVAFPPGGVAYLHRHQGPGIRCLIEGGIRIDTHGRSTSYGPGGAGSKPGPTRYSRRPRGPAEPLHPGDDPAADAAREELDPVCRTKRTRRSRKRSPTRSLPTCRSRERRLNPGFSRRSQGST